MRNIYGCIPLPQLISSPIIVRFLRDLLAWIDLERTFSTRIFPKCSEENWLWYIQNNDINMIQLAYYAVFNWISSLIYNINIIGIQIQLICALCKIFGANPLKTAWNRPLSLVGRHKDHATISCWSLFGASQNKKII